MVSASPTVAAWELVLRIREQSQACGIKAAAIQKALDVSAAYWSQVMHYRGVLTEEKLIQLMELLDFDADERTELIALRKAAKERGWWAEYSSMLHPDLLRFYGLEDGARHIRGVEGGVMPGLLQTEDYARALMLSVVSTRPTEAERRVRIRMRRQYLLDRTDPLRLSVVIGQAALMQQVGGAEVQRGQLRHLIDVAERYRDTVEIRVVPFDAYGSVAGLNVSTLHLLDFDSVRLPTLGWYESAIQFGVTEDRQHVETFEYLFKQVAGIALPQPESLELIDRVARQLE
ncbi:helix-turn-helix domain-containing protein [Nocardia cyriacigeorgica]|uniref:Helix-turn-helix domain-containing protein n=1 Tax=Nocardia cyriacigeorgica TaxID=135487 RepID=A0A5R8PBL7_9NOCA|nr:DUF5753 domain-containing protein [Nocardia cyriacigeorgica]TLG03327.1 helix-turn-helix domain-containing protein [Nocardia cyriacigeorgica]